jgi:hypothetical protein
MNTYFLVSIVTVAVALLLTVGLVIAPKRRETGF